MSISHHIESFVHFTRGSIVYDLRPYESMLEEIRQLRERFSAQSDRELRELSIKLRGEAATGGNPDELLSRAFALVCETCRRQLQLSAFDEQLIAGIALHQGKLIEMQTGEGKTLAAVFPAYLNALTGKGVHILTFNDYLAERDANWMRPVFEALGLSVDFIREGMDQARKKAAYQADITYAAAKEVGFDYLRSFIATDPGAIVLRPLHYVIIDEADALLIDEARNPLVLAGDLIDSVVDFRTMAQLAGQLEQGVDFDRNDYDRNIFLTEKGIRKAEEALDVANLLTDEHYPLHAALSLALHARMLLRKDVDYVIREGKIKLVDEFTGRIVEDRKWRNGLQTAVEAKEGLELQSEGRILNAITFQHFIGKYPSGAGMTATARQSVAEFHDFYQLPVVVIPPHQACRRVDHPDEIFATRTEKMEALLAEVQRVHQAGQPILIGTLTVRESEELAGYFLQNGIVAQVLNAKNDQLEATVIAEAGRIGAVTISTNMAGRGTDILLGGKDGREREEVIRLGGLYVIGTNRHESGRVDQQLRGRAGRQGDIGESRFFLSMQDDLMIRFQLRAALPKRYRNFEQAAVPMKIRRKFVDHIQRVMEGQAYDMRKTLLLYNELVEKQRLIIQHERQAILFGGSEWLTQLGALPAQLNECPVLIDKIRQAALHQYDKQWSAHLDYLQRLRDGIHLVRFAGQKPLLTFQKHAHARFQQLCEEIDESVYAIFRAVVENPDISPAELGVEKPASTWTYIVNDNTFGNQVATMLLDNSNIGFQVDFISVMVLFFVGLFRRGVRWLKRGG